MTTTIANGSTALRPWRTTPMQRRALASGSVGQFVEFYDFTLYGLSAVTLSVLFFPDDSALVGLLAVFATFGVAFAARPLGGLFFGALGDRIGRRGVLHITLLSIGVATAAIGVLPTHAAIGWPAPALLVLCRLVQGFSAGGESVGAPTFVFEHAPAHRRGTWLNVTLAATALPSVVAGTLILLLSASMSDHAFTTWGWRVPFLLALPAALIGLWIRRHTEESTEFRRIRSGGDDTGHTPLRRALRENRTAMLRVVVVLGLTAMGFYCLAGYFVTYAQTVGGLSREQSLAINAVAMTAYTVLLPLGGLLGDRVGRRPMLIAGSAALALLSVPCFVLVTSGSLLLAALGQLLFVVALCVYGGGCYAFFMEVFTTRTRFTSAAVSYNTAYALLGGTAPLVATALVTATGTATAPGYYLAGSAAAVLLFLTLTRVPETRGRMR
ncbi:MFS transporter [Streptomyces sp. NPDC004667]|uniref:MFS transporter n=1 Tax=Streptomyces sp. NPDC004667 TaxID=3154285 RepID=UPI0033B8063C